MHNRCGATDRSHVFPAVQFPHVDAFGRYIYVKIYAHTSEAMTVIESYAWDRSACTYASSLRELLVYSGRGTQ